MTKRVELDFQGKDGSTLRAKLQQAERSTGEKIIEDYVVPDTGAHIWGWFWSLSDARPDNGFGPGAVSFSEIAAWASLTGARPTPWEVETLAAMDRAYLASVAKISS